MSTFLKTRLCDLLGIRYPIIQAPMNWVSGADLVAAVSNAGGLGTLAPNAGQKIPSDDPVEVGRRLRAQIKKVRSLTDKPFALNIIAAKDPENKKFSDVVVEIAIEEKVPAAIIILGPPETLTGRLHAAGIKVLHCVTLPNHAVRAENTGVDAVISEGYEGGGHIGVDDLTTLTLVPQVVDAVKIPVVAGGGIGDARGLVAALALGAEGVYMGTRFLATVESDAHPAYKAAVAAAAGACTVAYGRKLGGGLIRQLKNEVSQRYITAELSGASSEELKCICDPPTKVEGIAVQRLYHSVVRGDMKEGVPAAGQASPLIHQVVSAAEVINEMVAQAREISGRLKNVLST